MDHELAARDLFAERYLLGELTADERADFEEHFFDCAACAAAVREGASLIDNGRAAVTAQRRFQKGRLMTWLPSAVAAALAIVVAVQSFVTIPRMRTAESAIEVVDSYNVGNRAGDENPRAGKKSIAFFTITTDDEAFASYVCEFRDASGRLLQSHPISKQQATKTVSLLLRPLPAGSYVLTVFGVREDGTRRKTDEIPVNVVQGP